jgi:hypothetical protein
MAKSNISRLADVMKDAREAPLPAPIASEPKAPRARRTAKPSASIAPGRPIAGARSEKLTQFGFVLDPEEHRALRRKALDEGRPAAEIVRDLIRRYVKRP